jgi:pimeloyl-ACP methyl ester carboxylesterase
LWAIPTCRVYQHATLLGSAIKGLPLLKYRWLGGEKNLIKEIIAKHVAALGYDQLDVREQAEVVLYGLRRRRGINLRGAMQHFTAVTISGSRYEKLKTLYVPTLIVHGTADQMMPVEHGQKLSATIPNAKAIMAGRSGPYFSRARYGSAHKKYHGSSRGGGTGKMKQAWWRLVQS